MVTFIKRPQSPTRQSRRLRVASRIAISLIVPALFLLFWQVGVHQRWELPFGIRMAFVPQPSDVAATLWDYAFGGIRNDAFGGKLWADLAASLVRVLTGFGVAVAVAVPLGVLMGRYELVDTLFDFFINVFRPIPATAWVPLVALVIGIGDQATVFLIALSAFFPVVLGSASGARQVPVRLVESARMLGSRPADVFLRVVLPAAAPAIVNGLRVGLGLAWVILVLGETVGVRVGLGAMISLARDLVRTDLIVVGMICIGLMGLLCDRLLVAGLRLATQRRPLFK